MNYNYDEIITKEMSDEEIIAKYTEALYGKNQSMVIAGFCAGEMHERGYDIVETEDNPYEFTKESLIKQNKSKAKAKAA